VPRAGVAVSKSGTTKAAISLAGWATVTGTIVDATTGAPIAGVTAWIEDAATILDGDKAPWITDAAGKFKLERVPPGKGEVVVYTGGGEPVHAAYTATEGATFDVGTIKATPAPPAPEPTKDDLEPPIDEPDPTP
jgi:hypothetical protein